MQIKTQLPSRRPNRLKGYDYSQAGYYFITICTHNRQEWFGFVNNGKMELNDAGKIVQKQIKWLSKQYPHVCLDAHGVMPNHVHMILIIRDYVGNGRDRSLHNKPLSSVIGALKTTSAKFIHQNGITAFRWQKSFYDHIIRNEESLNKIREYIINNPETWDSDENNLKNDHVLMKHNVGEGLAPSR